MLSSQPEFKNLLLLHGRDRRFYKLKIELELIPREQIRLQEQIGKEKLSIEIALNEWRELETRNNSLESEIISISDQVNRLKRQQLEVKKNEEYSALENEINSSLKNQSLLEDEQLDVLMRIDDARNTAEIAENKITLKIQELEKKLSSMEQRSEEVQKEIKTLESEIEDARKQVEPQFLSHYDRTKTVISKPPYMAPVEDQRCSGCNLRVSNDVVSSILVERKITQCDQCGRIVYAER
tara:strand:- start:153 stop:869 length:717 start_codon:yes stop_codon:yes gene_type:complete